MVSVRPRFLLISALIITVALVLSGFAFLNLFGKGIERRVDSELTNLVNQIAGGLQFDNEGFLKPPTGLSDPRFKTAYGGLYWQIDDTDGKAQLRSRSLWDTVLPLPEDAHDAGTINRYYLPGPDQGEVYAQERSLIVATPTGARTIRIAVAIDKASMVDAKSQFWVDLIPYLGALGAILLAASALQFVLTLKPLLRVSNDLTNLYEAPGSRLDGDYPIEIRHLVEAVNGLLDFREKTNEKSRARAADLAHGLKTPLTVLANNAQKLKSSGQSDMAAEISALVSTMENHINHELARSRIAPGPEYRKSNADLQTIIDELVRALSKTPKGNSIAWQMAPCSNIMVKIDPNDLRELVGNVLENALKWARHQVTIHGQIKSNFVELTIEDDGPGIAPELIDEMTDRGKRFDEKTPGTGLGLAIVKDIAEAYNLAVSIQNRQERGLSVKVLMPIADQMTV